MSGQRTMLVLAELRKAPRPTAPAAEVAIVTPRGDVITDVISLEISYDVGQIETTGLGSTFQSFVSGPAQITVQARVYWPDGDPPVGCGIYGWVVHLRGAHMADGNRNRYGGGQLASYHVLYEGSGGPPVVDITLRGGHLEYVPE